jgi:hypothetical protein
MERRTRLSPARSPRVIVRYAIAWIAAFVSTGALGPPAGAAHASPAAMTPGSSAEARARAAYDAHHPRLLFTPGELPALREKIRDGGRDDDAYAAVVNIVRNIYPTKSYEELFLDIFGIDVLPNIGVAAYLETPVDTSAIAFGRRVTLYLVDSYDPDDNTFYSPLRMRALALGYDMFFSDAPDTVRDRVRGEIAAYVDSTLSMFNYKRWLHSPYLSNLSAMIGSALGIAALCLEDELPHDRFLAALDAADSYVRVWQQGLLDPGGSYHEGPMYAGWSTQNLVYYFWARKRLYDGFDYATLEGIRGIEKWIAFSTLPIGGATINNVNDAAYLNYPLSRHYTYLDWAETAWDSGLSAWLWERFAGPDYGHDSGILADKTATVLWHRPLAPVNPAAILPHRMFWRQHGLYYYRTGWPQGDRSDDVVFSFYSGKFRGGHAQEDQNNFTLYGYGTVIAADNGFGRPATETEAHNLVLIDGRGEHNAGASVGTDGNIRSHLLSGFADHLLGDATAAYTTYSEYNRPGYPFPDDDWSYGYDGGNPVEFANRRVVVVHDPAELPYFVVGDEIRKDSAVREYSWRMHTLQSNSVDASANPIEIGGGSGTTDLFVLDPPFDSLAVALIPFDNGNEDPNTTVISLTRECSEFRLCTVLVPHGATPAGPGFLRYAYPWGAAARLSWQGGIDDFVITNPAGDEVACPVETQTGDSFLLKTDARLAVLRIDGAAVTGCLATEASTLTVGETPYASIADGRMSFAAAGDTVFVDRCGADFRFYMPGGGRVFCENAAVPVFYDGGFLVPDLSGTPPSSAALGLRSFPNPFNLEAAIVVDTRRPGTVAVRVYDVGGRLVTTLWNGDLPEGSSLLRWNGEDQNGDPAATGVYFIKAEAPGSTATIKTVLLK